jgi:hypothetical protein
MLQAADVVVSHYSPGRLRLKAHVLKRNEAAAKKIEATLCAVPGIERVATNSLTGSLLIEFSSAKLDSPTASRRLLVALAELFPEHFGPDWLSATISGLAGHGEAAQRIRASLESSPGIREASVAGGELSIRFDPEQLSIPAMLERLAR